MLLITFTLIYKKNCLIVEWGIIELNTKLVRFPVLVDPTSSVFIASVCIISSAVLYFSTDYISSEKFFLRFHLLVLGFVSSMLLLIISPHLVTILIG